MSADFFNEYWLYFAVGGGIAVIAVLLIVLVAGYYCCCRKRRRDYVSIPSDYIETNGTVPGSSGSRAYASTTNGDVREVGLVEGLQQRSAAMEQSKRETALLNCQYYLRGNSNYYLDTHLPDIGSRMSKRWFLVRPVGRVQPSFPPNLMTMLPVSQQCCINWDTEDRAVLNELLSSLSHPYLHSIQQVDIIKEKSLIVVVESFVSKGSLKDLIYQTTPMLDWTTKYSIRRNGLKLAQIQTFGRQILEAVMFLYSLGFKSLGQIQSGNVYLEGNRCKLSGFENSLLGYRPRVYQLVKRFKKVDSAMFGHLLYELGSGCELRVSSPSTEDMANIRHPQVAEVVRFILHGDTTPDIAEVLQLEFFQQGQAQELKHWDHDQVTLSKEAQELIRVSYNGKRRPLVGPAKKRKRSQSNSAYPVYGSPSRARPPPPPGAQPVAKATKAVAKTTKSVATAAEPPPQERLPAPSQPKSAKRSALLGAIRKGKTLRPTVTNDRSAPVIK